MKKALIVGNGASSVNPFAKELYGDKDVFRVNKFFLEPNLLYGRNIKFAVFPGEPFFVFFVDYLIRKHIYSIDIVCYKKLHKRFFLPKVKTPLLTWDNYIEDCQCKESVPGFYNANQIDSQERYSKITTGPYLVNCAIQMGYKDISIIGMDFYSEKSGKKYPISIPKIWKKISPFEAPYSSIRGNKNRGNAYDQGHGIKVDIAYIETLAANNQNVKFSVYVDEDNTYKKWRDIAAKAPNNVSVCLMEGHQPRKLASHCLPEIKAAVLEYKTQYFWQDKMSNAKHLFANRKPVVRKFIYLLKERVLNFWTKINIAFGLDKEK